MWRSSSGRARLAALAALTVGACAAVGPDFSRPEPPVAAGYAMPGDAAAAVRLSPEAREAGAWWSALGSPQLDQVVRLALAGSPTLAEADAVLARAQAEAAAARGAGSPQVDYSADAQRERINTKAFGFDFPSPTVTLYSIGGTVSYDLDLFGGRRRAVEGAMARAEAQAWRADAAYLTLTGDIALQALRIATLRAEIATIGEIIEDDRLLLEMFQAAKRAGGATPGAVLGGQAQIARDRALLPPLERDVAAARHRMALLAGRSPGEWAAPDFDLADFTFPGEVPVSVPSSLARRRPDILAAEADLHAALADVGVATARLYPDIQLTAGLTQGALSPGQIFDYASSGWNLGANLTGPLFDGGTRRSQRESARAEAQAAQARYQRTVLAAFVQVSDALAALAEDERSLRALEAAQAATQQSLRNAREAYRLGGGAQLAVLDAQRLLNDARRSLARARGQRYTDLVRLLTATATAERPVAEPATAGR